MAQLKRLLVATDGSEFSEGAVREAIRIAKQSSAGLVALSVIDVNPEFLALAPQAVENIENKTREHLESVKSRATEAGIQCDIVVHEGEETCQFITDEAAKNNVDMVVMGRRGRRGIMKLLMGSVTARVVGHCLVNVLVVPRNAQVGWKNILVATDGSEYGNRAVNQAMEIAKTFGSALNIAHVINIMPEFQEQAIASIPSMVEAIAEQVKGELEKIKTKAGAEGINTETFVREGEPYMAIVGLAKELNADVIVIGSHGRTGISRLLMGSVAERVIGHAECAVLVVKSKA
ncbi:MAG: universal stress protein [Nitrospirae bacterium]|nr:universal stress protein [Nitrospirota bacterium]